MIKKLLKIFLMFAFIIVTYNVISNAGISSTSTTIQSGEEVSILVTSDIQLSAYTVKVTGNSGLQFVTSSGGSGAGTTSISDAKAEGGMTRLATFKFKAPEVDKDQTYQITFLATGMGDLNLNAVADSTCASNITVKAKEQTPTTPTTPSAPEKPTTPSTPTVTTKSSVATLSNLGITPNDFSGFSKNPNKEEWNAGEVPYEVETVQVYASKGHSGQSITGTGNRKLNVGINSLQVTVTAEDGKTTKKYTINVTRKESTEKQDESEENPEVTQEEQPMEEVFGLSELKIEGIELEPQFQTDIYEYKINLTEELDKLAITTLATEANSNIEILGNEKLLEGENVITIHVKNENGEKNATYQITVNKTTQIVENVINETQNIEELPSQTQDNKKKIIVVLVAVLVIILIIIVAIITKARKNKYVHEDDYDYVTFEDFQNDEETDTYDDVYEEVEKINKSRGKRFK